MREISIINPPEWKVICYPSYFTCTVVYIDLYDDRFWNLFLRKNKLEEKRKLSLVMLSCKRKKTAAPAFYIYKSQFLDEYFRRGKWSEKESCAKRTLPMAYLSRSHECHKHLLLCAAGKHAQWLIYSRHIIYDSWFFRLLLGIDINYD